MEINEKKEPEFPLATLKALNEIERKLKIDNLYASRLVSIKLLKNKRLRKGMEWSLMNSNFFD